ncbi:hypothetical protein DLO39_10355 [Salmonella enterica]|nr:hypothetical protein [Salmonella enterica]EBN1926424.1 hypothetical protein [Salmonella enterica]
MTSNPLTDKQIALAVELAKARVEYVRKHGSPLLNNEEEVTLIALRELQDKRKLLKVVERRIAELEARTVNLPKLSVGEAMRMSGFSRDYAEGWCAGNDNAIHEIRTAGIKVKES